MARNFRASVGAKAGTLSLSASSYSANELATLSVTVTRSVSYDGDVAVDWSLTGLTEGAPSVTSGTLYWIDGESSSKTISLTFTAVTANRTGTLTLSNARVLRKGKPPSLGTSSASVTVLNATGTTVLPVTQASVFPVGQEVGASSTGYDYYISPTGSLSNPGTEASPWSIEALNGSNKPIGGKRIGLLPGTYDLQSYATSEWGGAGPRPIVAFITATGSAQNPTVLESTVPRAAVLRRPSGSNMQTPSTGGPLFFVARGANYLQWKNITFDTNLGNGPAIQTLGDYTLIEGCDFYPVYNYSTMNGTTYHGDDLGAIYFDAAGQTFIQSPVIRNNNFRGAYNTGTVGSPPTGSSNNSASVFGFSVQDMVYEYNTCTNMYGLVRTKYDWYGFTVRYNHGYNILDFMQHLAVPLSYNGRVSYHHNLVFAGCGGYQNELSQKNADADIYNNTIINVGGGGPGSSVMRWWRQPDDPVITCTFKNNLVHVTSPLVSPKAMHRFVEPWETMFSDMNYNLYPSTASIFRIDEGLDNYNPDAVFPTLAAWQAESGFEANSTHATPTFVGSDPSIPEHWKLQAGSAGKTAGEGGTEVGCWGGTNPPTQIGCDF